MSYSESAQPQTPVPTSSRPSDTRVISTRPVRASSVELRQIDELMYQDDYGVETWIALGEARRLVKQSER
jgi:hypothetical protein